MTSTGRFTLPSEENFAEKTKELAELWGADAIRNSDGTHLDESVLALGKKIYSAYFPTRAHNEWITLHMDETPQVYLLTGRVLAEADIVDVPLMDGFFEEQLKPNRDADPHKYWEVVDRTTNEVVDASLWTLDEDTDTVHVFGAELMHEHTVSFLAYIIWDPVEMYNHLTNGWGDKEHEIPFDIYHPATRKFVFDTFEQWLKDSPQTDVVRFTTFFYQFTLLFDEKRREKVVDWFGCACTVSPRALDDFEAKYGYRLRPEDFVDGGAYNSAWRVPRKAQRDWIDFLSGFVRENVKQLADMSHAAGKEAMMFLGDQWIGTEPYKDGFDELGLDAVVGSIGDGTTTRMIADIPGVKYTEGRFLPYFFPDTFYEGNDPSIEGLDNWRKARRAILRSPISRMGYGGYLSLAAKFPKFVDAVEHISDEFRDIHDRTDGEAARGVLNVAILNCWGSQRRWMSNQVHHAIWHRETYSAEGVLECLSGMPFEVEFISFDDVRNGIPEEIKVIINVGDAYTAFSGAENWIDEKVLTNIRRFVDQGGGFIGVGEPTAYQYQGRYFQLSDVLGVDREMCFSLSTDKYNEKNDDHFILEDIEGALDFGEGTSRIYAQGGHYQILAMDGEYSQLVVNEYGRGHSVYFAGLPYSPQNCRLLLRAIYYAAGMEQEMKRYYVTNVDTEVTVFQKTGKIAVINNSAQAQHTELYIKGKCAYVLDLKPGEMRWVDDIEDR